VHELQEGWFIRTKQPRIVTSGTAGDPMGLTVPKLDPVQDKMQLFQDWKSLHGREPADDLS
jgi:hypothetical protein